MRTTPKMLINRLMSDLPFAHYDAESGKIVVDSGAIASSDIIRFVKKLLMEKFAPLEHDLKELRAQVDFATQVKIDDMLDKLKRTKYIH